MKLFRWMLRAAALGLIAVPSLASCSNEDAQAAPMPETPIAFVVHQTDPHIYADPETGCEYFVFAGGVTPRLFRDGARMVGKGCL